jgi:hypothetical protein
MKSGDLEMLYKKLFCLIAKVEPFTAEIMIARMPFTRFLELLIEIAKRKYRTQTAYIENLVQTVRIAQEVTKKRNEIVHSGWIDGLPEDENTYYRYKIDLTREDYSLEEGIPCKIEELNSIEEEIKKAIDKYGEFMSKFVLRK